MVYTYIDDFFTPAKLLRNLLIYAYQWGEKDVIDFLGKAGEKER